MVELGIGPVRRIVALLTRRREAQLNVVHRRGRVVIVLLVAADAGRAAQRVIVIDVAHHARNRGIRVEARQRETYRAVIESRRHPSIRRVALLAIRRESRPGVHRVVRLLEIRLVAVHTSCVGGAQVVVIVRVTACARRGRMHPGQGKSRGRVIEFRVQPVVETVALGAIGRELAGHVVRIAGFAEIGRVAAVAICRRRAEVAQRSILVTGVALNRSMSAQQRKPVLVILNCLHRNFPARDRVALLATRA